MKNMHIKKIVITVFLAIYTSSSFCETVFGIMSNKASNEIFITIKQNNIIDIFDKFNYIPQVSDLFITFKNGSLLGFFPKKDDSLTISAWNSKNHAFDLVFYNAELETKNTIASGSGWDFHIIPYDTEDTYWVAIVPEGKSELFLINNKGEISKRIRFTSEFCPDVVTIEKQGNKGILKIESLDKNCEYTIDFNKLSATKISK